MFVPLIIEDVVDDWVRKVVINEHRKVIEWGDVAEVKGTQERRYIILLKVDPVKQQNIKQLVSMSSRTSSHETTEIFHDEKRTKQLPKRLVKSLKNLWIQGVKFASEPAQFVIADNKRTSGGVVGRLRIWTKVINVQTHGL